MKQLGDVWVRLLFVCVQQSNQVSDTQPMPVSSTLHTSAISACPEHMSTLRHSDGGYIFNESFKGHKLLQSIAHPMNFNRQFCLWHLRPILHHHHHHHTHPTLSVWWAILKASCYKWHRLWVVVQHGQCVTVTTPSRGQGTSTLGLFYWTKTPHCLMAGSWNNLTISHG